MKPELRSRKRAARAAILRTGAAYTLLLIAAVVCARFKLLGLLPSRATRLPIVPLSDAELGELRTDLVRAGLLDLVAG